MQTERQIKRLRFIDLYCGAGLGGRGAVNAGAEPVLAVDAWDIATQTYKANFPGAKVITGKVEDIDLSFITKGLSAEVLLTSPECTSHSIARGSRKANEKSRETAINILPWVEELAPKWIIVENVSRMKNWKRHPELKAGLESLGYTISELLLNASSFGAPQARNRLFLIGDLEGQPPTMETFEKQFTAPPKTASEIIEWDTNWATTPLYKTGRAENTLRRAQRAIETLEKGKPFLIVYYGSDSSGGWQSLDAPLRTITTIDRFALVTYVNQEYRMRMLQPSELLRAMGAEKHLLPYGTRRNKVKLCGNGVCAPVMEAIFKEIYKITYDLENIDF